MHRSPVKLRSKAVGGVRKLLLNVYLLRAAGELEAKKDYMRTWPRLAIANRVVVGYVSSMPAAVVGSFSQSLFV